jgi:hypothetical protein
LTGVIQDSGGWSLCLRIEERIGKALKQTLDIVINEEDHAT